MQKQLARIWEWGKATSQAWDVAYTSAPYTDILTVSGGVLGMLMWIGAPQLHADAYTYLASHYHWMGPALLVVCGLIGARRFLPTLVHRFCWLCLGFLWLFYVVGLLRGNPNALTVVTQFCYIYICLGNANAEYRRSRVLADDLYAILESMDPTDVDGDP